MERGMVKLKDKHCKPLARKSKSFLPEGCVISYLKFAFCLVILMCASQLQAQEPPVKNVIVITMDGLRWQELFGGVDKRLVDSKAGVSDSDGILSRFWDNTPEQRKRLLMPFLWSKIADDGQILGDPLRDSSASVTNKLNFSYPGYNEILTGVVDPKINSNAKENNANVTFLEWLNQKGEFQGRVAAFCSWDVFPYIINSERSKIPVNAGWMPLESGAKQEVERLNKLAEEIPHYWAGVRYDYFTTEGACEYIKSEKPRVLYVSLGETDDWAHANRYDLYLDAAQRNDAYIKKIWETCQAIPEYRDCTALLITTDHGRGEGFEGWTSHGASIPGCQAIWFAALGPGIPAKGNRSDVHVTQTQLAATVAKLLGYNYQDDVPDAAEPLPIFEE